MTRPDKMTYDSRNSPAENLATGRCLAIWRSHNPRARPIYRPCGKNSAVIAPDKSAVRDKASQDQNGSSCALTNRVGVAIFPAPSPNLRPQVQDKYINSAQRVAPEHACRMNG